MCMDVDVVLVVIERWVSLSADIVSTMYRVDVGVVLAVCMWVWSWLCGCGRGLACVE